MILLDTDALIWMLEESPKLGNEARARIAHDPAVHISAVSVAEIHIKAMLGKLRLPERLLERVSEQGLLHLSLNAQDAAQLAAFPELVRQDPFDRLLVAQAHRAGMDFITSDRTLLKLDHTFIVDARV